jgi:galactose mutarotase-like enzyme
MTSSRHHSLQNDELSVEILPDEGGRISSFKSLRSGMEFLTQSHRTGPPLRAGFNTPFSEGPCAGIEECLPSVGPCGPQTNGGPVPDHGDFWQLGWDVTDLSSTAIRMSAIGFSRTLRFSKHVSLQQDALCVDYHVENIGSTVQSFLYACHPLLAISAGDLILLPPEVRELRVDYSRGGRLGSRGTKVPWPQTDSGIRLDIVDGPESGTADMFYTARLSQGSCGLYRTATRQQLDISFDAQRLPYLGLWLCYGGWPENDSGMRQYAVALEPTTCGCNTLSEAQQNDSAITLDTGQTFAWELRFQISDL